MSTGTRQKESYRVSVVIVTRDRAKVLPTCLDSIVSQVPAPDEIVIVRGNDQSFPQSLRDRYDQVQIIVVDCSEPNISIARNMGIEHVSGTMVLFIDDDAIAHEGWVSAYIESIAADQHTWAAGGSVYDARQQPMPYEFDRGLVHPSGRQIEVLTDSTRAGTAGFRTSVKGCNFALHLDRLPSDLRFDPFFRFAFDESDLIMGIHERGGGVVHVTDAIVDHRHSPGAYRADGIMDRDWITEFASHTRFMRKHTMGVGRIGGWFIVIRRLAAHSMRSLLAVISGKLSIGRGSRCIRDAIAGIRHGASSRDSV